jgi:hypothetical protein
VSCARRSLDAALLSDSGEAYRHDDVIPGDDEVLGFESHENVVVWWANAEKQTDEGWDRLNDVLERPQRTASRS